MAVKKTEADKTAEIVKKSEFEENQNSELKKISVKETERFCVYIGPSIRGVIQSGTIYKGSLKNTKEFLRAAIEKYPLIMNLLSTDKTISEDRIKVKTAGNLLYVYYMKLAAGKSI